MNILLGATNTAVLICSSLSMALGVRAAQMGKTKLMVMLLLITIVFGFGFLGIKARRVSRALGEPRVSWTELPFRDRRSGASGDRSACTLRFTFGLYWAMTGLHALHMIIGIGLVTWLVIAGFARGVQPALLQPGRERWTVLALCRFSVDLSLSALYLISHKHGG